MRYKYGKHTRNIWGCFYFYFSFLYFGGVFKKTIMLFIMFSLILKIISIYKAKEG